MDKMAVNINCY